MRATSLRNQLTCVVLVTCVHTRCPVAAYARVSFASNAVLSPADGPRSGRFTAACCVKCRCCFHSQGHSLVGVRSKDSLVERRRNPLSTRQVTDATREQSKTHNRRNTRIDKGRENKEPRGVHPFVISNVLRTAARPRAALPSFNVQSFQPSPMT